MIVLTNYNDKFMDFEIIKNVFLLSTPKISFRPSMFLFLTCRPHISVRSSLMNVQQRHISGITKTITVTK